MIIKMKMQATPEQIEAVKQRLYELGSYQIGDIVGTERVIIGVKGDVTALPEDQSRYPKHPRYQCDLGDETSLDPSPGPG